MMNVWSGEWYITTHDWLACYLPPLLPGIISNISPQTKNKTHCESKIYEDVQLSPNLFRRLLVGTMKNVRYILGIIKTTNPLMYSNVKQRKWFWSDFPFWFSSDDWTWCIGKLIIENISVRYDKAFLPVGFVNENSVIISHLPYIFWCNPDRYVVNFNRIIKYKIGIIHKNSTRRA